MDILMMLRKFKCGRPSRSSSGFDLTQSFHTPVSEVFRPDPDSQQLSFLAQATVVALGSRTSPPGLGTRHHARAFPLPPKQQPALDAQAPATPHIDVGWWAPGTEH